jgi:probable F420-dependent oxidoreductase
VQCGPVASGDEFRARVRAIEASGYSTLFVPDHFVDQQLSPMVTLAAAAEATTTLRVGTLVLGNDYRHPAAVAKEATTIDLLSDARVELGIGAGWMTADYDALDLVYDSPGTRIARLAAAIAVIKGCWSPGAFSFSGEHYTIAEYDATPEPVQQPHPPVLVGGGGRKVLSLAGREADIVGINPNLRAGALTADAVRSSLADLTAKRSSGFVRQRGSASTRSSCRSATSSPPSPTTAVPSPECWPRPTGSLPTRRSSRASRWWARSTRSAISSSNGATSGACRTSSSAMTTSRRSPLSWPAWRAPEQTLRRAGALFSTPRADVAQLVERNLAKVEVAGSNPVVRSTSQLILASTAGMSPRFATQE